MRKLIEKYDSYVADRTKAALKDTDETDSFDQAVQETLKEQLY